VLCALRLQVSREKALQFIDSISLNLESNDPHEHIERNIRDQINIITDNFNELQKMTASLEEVCL
jgi:hypothetical protein